MSDQSGRQSGSARPQAAVRVAAFEPGVVSVSTSRGVLVERAIDGDRAAFEALLERWLEPALRTALAILGNEADARDATQEAFLQAWRELRKLRDPERFDAWLGRILVNSCRGLRRGLRHRTVREISLDVLPGGAEPSSGFDADWDDQPASLDAIEHAFERLNVGERTILVLHHLEHRPLTDVAAVLGIPVGTAKSRLSAARHALERALEAELR